MNPVSYKSVDIKTIKINSEWTSPFNVYLTDSTQDNFKYQYPSSLLNIPAVLETTTGFDLIIGNIAPDTLGNIFCLILPKDSVKVDILFLILSSFSERNLLSPIIKSYFIELCLKFLPEQSVMEHYFDLLGIKKHNRLLQESLMLLHLQPSAQQLIHKGILSETTGKLLSKYCIKDQVTLVETITDLQLGGSKQRRLLELASELAHRNNTNISEVFSSPSLADILTKKKQNPPQTTGALLSKLQELCSPASTEATQQFHNRVKQLNLPKQCKANHSLSFEKDEVTLEIIFDSLDTLENKWKELKENL